MPDDLRISIVVVSYGRPAALRRCLRGLAQQRYGQIEIIAVADADGLAIAQAERFSDQLRLVSQDAPNISVARNTGIAAAAGDIVAFIDDDAVPEPTWASHISKAFQNPDLDAVTGRVLGRNGISIQWGRMSVDRQGRDRRLGENETLEPGETLKLHGTNMAVRRTALVTLGGFDPAFAFFLDDTDLALRLDSAGHGMSYLDHAVVHHGYAASARRTADRVPLSLFDIGASTRVFLTKHAPECDAHASLRVLESDQRARLLRLAWNRKLSSQDIRQLMESLQAGWAAGEERISGRGDLTSDAREFETFRSGALPEMRVLAGRRWQAGKLRKEAADLVTQGIPVSLFLFEPTPRKHKVGFTDDGWWEQVGGLFGCADRTEPRVQFWGFSGRLAKECDRIAPERGIFE